MKLERHRPISVALPFVPLFFADTPVLDPKCEQCLLFCLQFFALMLHMLTKTSEVFYFQQTFQTLTTVYLGLMVIVRSLLRPARS